MTESSAISATRAAAGERLRQRRVVRAASKYLLIAAVAALPLVCVAATGIHVDVWHQMALMREAFRLGYVPTEELFAYTNRVSPSIHHEWGAGLIAITLATAGGGKAFVVFHFLLVGAIAAGILLYLKRTGARAPWVWAGVLLTSHLIAYSMHTQIAQTYSVFFCVILLHFLALDREGRQWWIAPWLLLFIPWVNLHGGLLVSFGILGVHTLERMLRRETWWHLPITGVAMAGLLLVNPYGTEFLNFLHTAVRDKRAVLAEWSPYWLFEIERLRAVLFLVTFGLLLYTFRSRGFRNVPGGLIVLLLGLVSFRMMRIAQFYGLAWLMIVPAALGRTPFGRRIGRLTLRNIQPIGAVSLLALALLLYIAVIRTPWKLKVIGNGDTYAGYPVGPVNFLKARGFNGKVMTDFGSGSYVSWKLYPSVKVSLDSRWEAAYDTTWGKKAQDAYSDKSGRLWREIVNEYPTDLILVTNLQELSRVMDKQHEWRRIYTDRNWRLYARPGLELPAVDWSSQKFEGVIP